MNGLKKLRLVSYLAPNMFWFYQAVATYLGRVFSVETQIVQGQYEALSDPLMLQDQLDIAFICGLPFVQLNQFVPDQLQVLVAPVMQASRYGDRPVYFADIIVNIESTFTTFNDLAGKTFCYNDQGSNSGYNLMRQRLMQSGYPSSFFAKVIESGSHQNSIKLVATRIADCSTIDSTVLEQQLRDTPELGNHLRVIESIGPCPMPPVIASQRLESYIQEIQFALCQPDKQLQFAMEQAQIRRYDVVQSEDYAPLGIMYDKAVKAGYKNIGT
jgi:phosphonate transport system substrate-binding protein